MERKLLQAQWQAHRQRQRKQQSEMEQQEEAVPGEGSSQVAVERYGSRWQAALCDAAGTTWEKDKLRDEKGRIESMGRGWSWRGGRAERGGSEQP